MSKLYGFDPRLREIIDAAQQRYKQSTSAPWEEFFVDAALFQLEWLGVCYQHETLALLHAMADLHATSNHKEYERCAKSIETARLALIAAAKAMPSERTLQ